MSTGVRRAPAFASAAMGFYFYPRGGSAQVVRYLCRALAGQRWEPTLFAGSLGPSGDLTNSGRFFRGLRCESLDYSPALALWRHGDDPMMAAVPMHASYEDKPGVPDRLMVDLDDADFARQVASWTRFLSAQSCEKPSVVHLHHLTPLHAAVDVVWPGVPVITHLHGTELKMLEAVRDGKIPPCSARFAAEWISRMRRWADGSDRVVVVSEQDRCLARDLLPIDATRLVTIASGVDTDVFSPGRDRGNRLTRWQQWLVDDPRGWRPGRGEGSVRYAARDLAAFTDDEGHAVPVVLFAGRFLAFKRLQLLIEAHHVLQSRGTHRSVLVIAGGFPGEWEGEHPYDTVRRLGAQGVFFTGWRDHDDLAEMLRLSDVFAAPSVDEPFGLVYLEAMSAGVPPIATDTGGPRAFINVGFDPQYTTGWLVPPDDVAAIVGALTEALVEPVDRKARGARAARFVRDQYSWASSAAKFSNLYDEVVDDRGVRPRGQSDRPMSGVA